MAASEVALSLAIIRLLDVLSTSKIYENLKDQIPEFSSNLKTILSARKYVELNDGHNQETQEGKEQLLLCARDTEKIAEAFLVNLLRDQMSESQEGCFAKVFALVRLFSVKKRAYARKRMAQDFTKKVGLLCKKFTPSQPPANESTPDNERVSSSSPSKRNQENTRQRVESDIVDRDRCVKDLLAWLIDSKNDDDPNLRVILVAGKQACGKTTLVRSVFSRLEIQHHFDCRIWIRVTGVGENFDWMQNLLVDILKQTPLGDEVNDLELQEERLFEMLHKSLMGLRYLIVLDNLHEPSLIHKLLVPFVDSMNGSRVIVTTHNAKMRKFADPWTPVLRLCPHMTHEESNKLLQVSIEVDNDFNWNIPIIEQKNSSLCKKPPIEQRIWSLCNGSPPEISLLGGLLSTVEKTNYDALIDRLRGCATLDNVMNLSFDELPYMMKPCVLYMAVFPTEYEVPTRRLFRLWAAEGLLAEAARGVVDDSIKVWSAEDCFCELESRNLICVVQRRPDGSARSCRMPAFIHDFFCRKAKELGLFQIQYNSDSVIDAEQSAQYKQKQAQITVTGHYGYKVQCLQSFALFDTRKLGTKAKIAVLLKSLFLDARLILLRVLDLEGVYKPVLPEKFGNKMRNLRYLGLRRTVLDLIPESVGNLSVLETLDLKHTNITKVPNSIWNAKNLRHLYLSDASFNETIQRQISSKKFLNTKLETLWGLVIETDDSPMIRVLEKLQSLQKLGVTCRPEAVNAVAKCLSRLTRLESLRLRSRDLQGQPAKLDLSNTTGPKSLLNLYLLGPMMPEENLSSILTGNLKALTLSMLELEEDPMPVLGHLKDLIILRLLARSYTGLSLLCRVAGFPKLRILKLWMLEELRDVVVEKGGMGNLEELELRQCKNLRGVYGLKHIDSLKSLSLTGVMVAVVGGVVVSQRTLVKPKELKW